MKSWKTTVNANLSRSQLNSSSSQTSVCLFVCRQHVISRISAVNQNASINKNSKGSNSRSLRQYTSAKSISLCLCFVLRNRSFHHTNHQISSRSRFSSRFSTRFSFSWSYILDLRTSSSAFAFISLHLSHLLWDFLLQTWSDWYLNHSQRILSQCRSIEEVKYSLRNEAWRRRWRRWRDSVTSMSENLAWDVILSAKVYMKTNVTWRTFLLLTFDLLVHICSLNQIFSFLLFVILLVKHDLWQLRRLTKIISQTKSSTKK